MDLFPKIEMDLIEETPDALKEEDESDEEEIKEVIEDKPVQEEVVPEPPAPRPVIDQSEVFQDKKPIIKPIKDDKPPKKKRVMSDEQKERLRLGREKALANRRANAQQKKDIKDLQSKKKEKEIKELKDYVNDIPSNNVLMPSVTEEQIQERTQKAIKIALMEHDTERKKRKVIKKQAQKVKAEEDAIVDMCVNASLYNKPPPKYGDQDFFDVCFR